MDLSDSGRRARVRSAGLAVVVLASTLAAAGVADSATPPSATLTPNSQAEGRIGWTGRVRPGTETATSDEGAACFNSSGRPDPTTSGCDFFTLNVSVPPTFWRDHPGVVDLTVTGFGLTDIDMYVYRRNANGTRGEFVTGEGDLPGEDENAAIEKAQGSYYVVLTPYATGPTQSYEGTAEFRTRKGPGIL